MKKTLKLFLMGGAAVIAGALFLIVLYKLPVKKLEWDNPTGPIGSVASAVKEFFSADPISILVLGKPGTIAGQIINGDELTDTIIAVNFDRAKNRISLISIPRDLWISDNHEQFKINEMLVKNKVDVAANKIEAMTGLSLDGYVVVDLAMVKDAVDYLGGVDVTLPKKAVDWVSGYTLEAGAHHLDGNQSVWLIRNRFDKEGDFFREKNQQQVIENLFSKFKNLSTAGKMDFIEKFAINSPLVKNSDIDAAKLGAVALGMDLSKITLENIVMDFSTGLFKSDFVPLQSGTSTKNVSILIPSEGFEKYGLIRDYVQKQMNKSTTSH